jgi:hypothetical protein
MIRFLLYCTAPLYSCICIKSIVDNSNRHMAIDHIPTTAESSLFLAHVVVILVVMDHEILRFILCYEISSFPTLYVTSNFSKRPYFYILVRLRSLNELH